MNKIGYIYLTTNSINGKKYIGQHRATKFDKTYKGSGSCMLRAIKKYGRENFESVILEWCYSEDELNAKEIYWIARYQADSSDDFYNIVSGGKAGGRLKGHTVSEETREKLRQANLGKIMPQWVRDKIRKSCMGKNSGDKNGAKKPELHEMFVQINSGENNPNYGKHWYNNGVKSVLSENCPEGFHPGRIRKVGK